VETAAFGCPAKAKPSRIGTDAFGRPRPIPTPHLQVESTPLAGWYRFPMWSSGNPFRLSSWARIVRCAISATNNRSRRIPTRHSRPLMVQGVPPSDSIPG